MKSAIPDIMIELWINIFRQASNPIYEDTPWGASTGRKRALLFIFRPYRITDMNERLWRSTVHKRVILENGFPAFLPSGSTEYAVKAQTSLAPLSRFRGSRITTAHEQQCCRFQSYAKTVPSQMKLTRKLTKREPHSWDLWQRTTWSRLVTSDFNSV